MALTPLRTLTAHTEHTPQLSVDSYLTDGIRLFRVLAGGGADARHDFVALEDCMTLQIHAYSAPDLDAMGLRSVAPEGSW